MIELNLISSYSVDIVDYKTTGKVLSPLTHVPRLVGKTLHFVGKHPILSTMLASGGIAAYQLGEQADNTILGR